MSKKNRDRWQQVLPVLAVVGLVSFGAVRLVDGGRYGSVGLEPEEVGRDYAHTLGVVTVPAAIVLFGTVTVLMFASLSSSLSKLPVENPKLARALVSLVILCFAFALVFIPSRADGTMCSRSFGDQLFQRTNRAITSVDGEPAAAMRYLGSRDGHYVVLDCGEAQVTIRMTPASRELLTEP